MTAVAARDVRTEFEDFLVARRPALLRAAYALTCNPHDAEDLLQSALVKVYAAWPGIRDLRAADAYVRRVMLNERTSWWRAGWRRAEWSTDQVPEPRRPLDGSATCTPESGPAPDERSGLWCLVLALPPRQRTAVVLRYYEDLTEAETAKLMRCSLGTVKSSTSRGLANLRRRAGDGISWQRPAPSVTPLRPTG